MKKPSEVIELAMKHPSYLNTSPYLCHVIEKQMENLTEDEIQAATHEVNAALGDQFTLQGALIQHGVIREDETMSKDEYRAITYKFWTNLIQQLKAEGK